MSTCFEGFGHGRSCSLLHRQAYGFAAPGDNGRMPGVGALDHLAKVGEFFKKAREPVRKREARKR
jgi:hypothetical protein